MTNPAQLTKVARRTVSNGDDVRSNAEPFKVFTTDQAHEDMERDYVVDDLIERDNIGLVVGYPESAKSTWTLSLAGSVVSGIPFFGHSATDKKHCALIFSPERPKEMKRRLRAYEGHHGVDVKALGIVGDDLDFAHGAEHARRVVATALNHEQRTGYPIGLIVFDTVFDLLGGGDENHPRDMGSVSRHLQQIRRETNAPILAVCHPSMDRAHEPRGHKSLLAKSDVTVVVTYDQKTGIRRWRVQKANSLEIKPKGIFTCKSVQIDQGTAPVIVAGGASAPAGSRDDVVRKLIEGAGGEIVVSELARAAKGTPIFENIEDDACRVAVDRIVKSMANVGSVEVSGSGKARLVRIVG
jgi:putative DNA primase/helicase